jgi:hypothetical protein
VIFSSKKKKVITGFPLRNKLSLRKVTEKPSKVQREIWDAHVFKLAPRWQVLLGGQAVDKGRLSRKCGDRMQPLFLARVE